MKDFNFEEAYKNSCKKKIDWLKENQHKEVTEEQFVTFMQSIRYLSKGRRNSERYSPSSLRGQYRNLVKNYNFFNK